MGGYEGLTSELHGVDPAPLSGGRRRRRSRRTRRTRSRKMRMTKGMRHRRKSRRH